MPEIKICPDCSAEFYAHIECCADCGAVLLSHEENKRAQEEKKRCMDRELEDQVIVREGDRKWMEELLNVLVDSGIPAALNVDTQCRKGCCNDAYRLLVSSRDAENANERIEEHFMKAHPELRASNEMISQGKCPACGNPAGPDTVECPDCGLILIVVDQGNDQQAADGCLIKNKVFLPGEYSDPK